MTPTDPRPEPTPANGGPVSGPAQPERQEQPAPEEQSAPEERSPRVVRPEQAREDTDAAWGDHPEPDEERLYRDRPPHWADF